MSNLPQPRPGILEISAYVPGESEVGGNVKPIKLSSNETPIGPSPKAIAAYQAVGAHLDRYPDGASTALRQAIARHYGLVVALNPRLLWYAPAYGVLLAVNVAYAATLTWANPVVRDLERQVAVPLFGENPVELGMSGREDDLLLDLPKRHEVDARPLLPASQQRDQLARFLLRGARQNRIAVEVDERHRAAALHHAVGGDRRIDAA